MAGIGRVRVVACFGGSMVFDAALSRALSPGLDAVDSGGSAESLHDEAVGELFEPLHARGLAIVVAPASDAADVARVQETARALCAAGFKVFRVDTNTRDRVEADGQGPDDQPGELTRRTVAATDWLVRQPRNGPLQLGYFALGSGVAPALRAAADRPRAVRAIVACGGEPSVVGDALRAIEAPTLLVVDSRDIDALRQHRTAQRRLRITNAVEQIDGVFTEPSTLAVSEQTFARARDWLLAFLSEHRS